MSSLGLQTKSVCLEKSYFLFKKKNAIKVIPTKQEAQKAIKGNSRKKASKSQNSTTVRSCAKAGTKMRRATKESHEGKIQKGETSQETGKEDSHKNLKTN